jgi:hypothetical protein
VAFSLRGVLIVLAVLAVLADGFIGFVRSINEGVKRSIDGLEGPRAIVLAWAAEHADGKPGLPPEALSDVRSFAAHLARAQGLTSPGHWMSRVDPVVKTSGFDLRGSILADGDKSKFAPGFDDAPLAWAIALVPDITKLPPETPVMWTRGLQLDGTWQADSPYGNWGGYVGYAGGPLNVFHGKITGLMKWSTKEPTDNIAEALPPGTRISEYTLTPQIVERIRRRELMVRLGVAGGLLIVGLGCRVTTFGRRHWLSLAIIGGSVVFQWWLAVR